MGEVHELEHGTRVPMIIRAPWLVGEPKSANVSTIVELIDIYPTIAELAGIPVPDTYKLDGSSFAPLVNSALSSKSVTGSSEDIHSYSLSVYPRCPRDATDPAMYWANNDCDMQERTAFMFIGISLRVPDWRYTEWLKWNGTALSPQFDDKPIGVELYTHAGDDGSSFDGPYEVYNLAGLSQYAQIQAQLAAMLRQVYPSGSLWPTDI